jgi:hypothetical protein
VNVTPGIRIKGRVRDTVTGKPVAGELMYHALAGNPHVLGIPIGEFYTQAVEIRADGTFTIAALPGPGFIGLTVKKGSYPAACVDATPLFPKGFNPKPTKDRLWITVGGQGLTSIDQESYQAILLLDVNADKPPGEQRIELTPAEPIRGRILDPDGKPLTGVRIRGMKSASDDWLGPLASADFTATPPHPDRPRRLTFRHEGRKLVGTLLATSDGKPIEVKLASWGTLTGRFVEVDGKPIAHATLGGIGVKGPEGVSMESVRVGTEVTDEKGVFQLVGLIPGVEYELYFREITPKGRSGIVVSGIKLKAGEKRDLGEFKIQKKEPE